MSAPSFGIPYAPADVDAAGYFVTCPKCGETFHAAPKGAVRAYGLHFEAKHAERAS